MLLNKMSAGYTLNIRGRLMDLSRPVVMGILNVTADSFYSASRVLGAEAIALRARQIVDEGGAIIDVGACSTRPDSVPVDERCEMERLRMALPVVRRAAPGAVVSVDTFRPTVARMAVEECGADIINDVGGSADGSPGDGGVRACDGTAASVPYILTSREATLRDTLLFFAREVERLHSQGRSDIIIDPGFGFGKSVEQNHELLAHLECLQVMGLPVLVGLSRKSMVCKPLGITASEALAATTALHAVALAKGASILRVHDVKEAVQAVTLAAAVRTV